MGGRYASSTSRPVTPPTLSQEQGGYVLAVGDGLAFGERELPLARRLGAAIGSRSTTPAAQIPSGP